MAYMNDYKWNTPIRCGKLTTWMNVLKYLNENGPSTKREILKNVFGKTQAVKYTWNSEYHKYDKEYFPIETAPSNTDINGNRSKLFSCMHDDNLIKYNKSTYTWQISSRGIDLLNKYSDVK